MEELDKDFKRFKLMRHYDVSGVSGTGLVAYGILFPNGKCCLSWNTIYHSVGIYDSLDQVIAIHTHEGNSSVVFVD